MAQIEVHQTATSDGWMFDVTVTEGGSSTRHAVSLSRADFQRLSGGAADPSGLVQRSFEFLLEREPKESILPSFDLTVIGRYFPEYEREVAGK